jgi:hypothetical protein
VASDHRTGASRACARLLCAALRPGPSHRPQAHNPRTSAARCAIRRENPTTTTYPAPRERRRGAVRCQALTVISPPLPVRGPRRITGTAGLCIAAGVFFDCPRLPPVNPARSQSSYALEALISCPVLPADSRRRRRIPRQRRKGKKGPKPTCLCRGKNEIGGSRAGTPNPRRGKAPSSSVLFLPSRLGLSSRLIRLCPVRELIGRATP